MANFFAQEFCRRGAKVQLLGHPKAGSALVVEFWGEAEGAKPILLLGHLDTVWDVGTLAEMPFKVQDGRAYGPGIYDMKSGIVCGLWAVQALTALKLKPAGPVRFFLNADEEMASTAFREELLAEARRARAVLVLEPAAARGALKTARKGVGEFQVSVHGRSAHAGINPSAGVNAISELARQILRIEKFGKPRRGLTVNVDVIHGGSRANVIPELATARVDVRVPTALDRDKIEKQMRSLQAIHPEARLEITGGVNRPPLERKMARELFRHARDVRTADGSGVERGFHRRRLRREFYRGIGNSDARWIGRNGRWSPRPPRACDYSRVTAARGVAGGTDRLQSRPDSEVISPSRVAFGFSVEARKRDGLFTNHGEAVQESFCEETTNLAHHARFARPNKVPCRQSVSQYSRLASPCVPRIRRPSESRVRSLSPPPRLRRPLPGPRTRVSIRMLKLITLKAGGCEFVARFTESQNRVMRRYNLRHSWHGMRQSLLDTLGEFLLHFRFVVLIAADVLHSQNRYFRWLVLLKIRDLIEPRLPGIRSRLEQCRNHIRTLKREVFVPVHRGE